MVIDGSVDAVTAEDLEAGDFFAFEIRKATYFGIGLGTAGGRSEPALISLYPGHPDLNGAPGLLMTSAVRGPVLRFPDARICLPSNRERIHCGFNEMVAPPGALFLVDSAPCVATRLPNTVAIYDISTGQKIETDPYGAVWFSEWEVIEPRTDGEPRVICKVASALPKAG